MSRAKLRTLAATMLPAVFAQQHLNQWASGTSSLFPKDVLDCCRDDKYPLDAKALAAGAAYVVGGGLDRAYGFSLHGDATVTTCVLRTLVGEDDHFFVLASDAILFSAASGIRKAFTRYHQKFGMSRLAIEAYNTQDILAWCGDQPFGGDRDGMLVHPTPERQSNAYTALYQAAAEGRLHVAPQFSALLREMESFEYRLEQSDKGVKPKFGAPKGGRDDHVFSLAWAVYSLRDCELNPYEIPGIHCDANGAVARLCALNSGDFQPPCAETCRSWQTAARLYEQYRGRNAVAPLSIESFIRTKLTNTGSHTVRR